MTRSKIWYDRQERERLRRNKEAGARWNDEWNERDWSRRWGLPLVGKDLEAWRRVQASLEDK